MKMKHRTITRFITLFFVIKSTDITVIVKPRLPFYLENQEKSGNLKTDQKIWGKLGNFMKLIDWQSPIEQTSRQC